MGSYARRRLRDAIQTVVPRSIPQMEQLSRSATPAKYSLQTKYYLPKVRLNSVYFPQYLNLFDLEAWGRNVAL